MTIDVLQFNPANWIQASDPNTLYDAETGGSLVAAGGAVARLEDKSGNGRHWTQATASYRPTRQVAVQNGKDVIRLDGVNDTMGRAGFMTGATAGTFLFVLKLVADPPVTVGLGAPFSAWGGYNGIEHMPWVDGNIYYNWGGNTRFNSGNPTQSMAAWRIFSITSAANSWILRIDGVTFYTSSSNTVTWGAAPKIGGAYGTYYPACDIAEAIAVPSLLSEAQRQKAEGYLAWEWGIQGNLDASHPYKNAAPTDTASAVGEGTITLGTLTQAAAGVLELKASSAKTLGAMTASSAGKIAISGDSAKALGVLTQTAQVTLLNNGQAAQTLGDLTQAAQGILTTSVAQGDASIQPIHGYNFDNDRRLLKARREQEKKDKLSFAEQLEAIKPQVVVSKTDTEAAIEFVERINALRPFEQPKNKPINLGFLTDSRLRVSESEAEDEAIALIIAALL